MSRVGGSKLDVDAYNTAATVLKMLSQSATAKPRARESVYSHDT